MNESTGCIVFRPKSKIVLLREDFVDICEGNDCAAMVLSQMLFWHETKLAHRAEAVKHNAEAIRMGLPATQNTELWVYKASEEMREELLRKFGEKAIGPAFLFLTGKGYLEVRANPYDKRDRKRQYRFQSAAVQAAIDALPPSLDTQKANRRIAECKPQECGESKPQNCVEQTAKLRDENLKTADSVRVDAGASSKTPSETNTKETHQEDAPSVLVRTREVNQSSEKTVPEKTALAQPLASTPTVTGSAAAPPRSEAKWRPDDFNALIAAYPKSDDRKDAIKSWDRLRPDDAFVALLLSAAERFTAHHKREGQPKRFICSLAVFLNGEKWLNEICQPPAVTVPSTRCDLGYVPGTSHPPVPPGQRDTANNRYLKAMIAAKPPGFFAPTPAEKKQAMGGCR